MVLDEAINKLVRDSIVQILDPLNFIAIRAKQDAPRPSGDYASVDVMADSSIGWEDIEYQDEQNSVRYSTSGARQILISINFFRGNAVDNARKVRDGFMRKTILQKLKAATLGLVERSQVRDLSEVLESKWEQRAQFDLTLSAVGNDSELLDIITHVIIDGEFQTRGKSIPINVEVNT